MAKALTICEIDIDRCSLTYGVPPCMAAIEGVTLIAEERWDFQNSVEGWTASGAGASITAGSDAAVIIDGTSNPNFQSPTIAVVGADNTIVRVEFECITKRASGSWNGYFYWETSGHAFSDSFRDNALPDLDAGDRVVIDIDLTSPTIGGSDWVANTITQIRLDFNHGIPTPAEFKLYSVVIGHYATEAEATGTRKCFNSLGTCQDIDNFTDVGVTLRFINDTLNLPADIEATPCLMGVEFSPSILSLGVDLGQRASLSVTLKDHADSDTGPNGDKYLSERDYDPFRQGTMFGKFKARHPYLRGRALRIIRGEVGQDLASMETHHFIIDSFDGPSPQGVYTLIAKDILKFADGDRAQAPAVSNGYLSAAIASGATSVTLSPTDVGAEYPGDGHLNIGGKEIVSYTHDPYVGLTAATELLMKFDGSDAGAATTDSSGKARTATAVGNVLRDTAQKRFGTASAIFDGVGDYLTIPDNAAWTPTGNFTIDFWSMLVNITSAHVFCSHTDGTFDNEYCIAQEVGGSIRFRIRSGGVTVFDIVSDAGIMIAEAWQHVALVRVGNVYTIYVDGFVVASGTYATAIPNFAGTFKIGGHVTGTSTPMHGWIDEFRFQSEATWTEEFNLILPGPYSSASKDVFTIVRAQLGTTAEAHTEQDRAQYVLRYVSKDPAFILADLLRSYAGIPYSWIPLTDWLIETDSFLQRLYTGTVAEPTSVNKLVAEIIEQAALAVWTDDEAMQIRLQVLRAISTTAALFDAENTLENTIQSKEQPDRRVSRVLTYFGQINPLKKVDEPDNYRSTEETKDELSEDFYGSQAIKKIYSRWIPAFGRTIASRLNAIILGRFKNPPRRITLDVFRDGEAAVSLGQGARVGAWFIQDDTGAPGEVAAQVTKVGPEADRFKVELEEMIFDVADNFNDRVLIIDVSTLNFNFRTAYDEIYPTPESGENINCIIQSGAIVGSSSTGTFAFTVGDWPAGVNLTLTIHGSIQGAGGEGGRGAYFQDFSSHDGQSGQAGGRAFYTRYALDINGAGGIYAGGGGGGGGGLQSGASQNNTGGGGGGGAGYQGGSGGDATNGYGQPGVDGQSYLGGGGEGGADGGDGGDHGQAGAEGNSGDLEGGKPGGSAGGAIDGNSYVTETGTVNIIGTRIN